jgi:CHAD domain-containing protein
MVVNNKEIEGKYEAPNGVILPEFEQLPQVARTSRADDERLEAEYYDTADLSLIRAGITLRRRTGGHGAGWHLKLPAGSRARQELRLPLAQPTQQETGQPTQQTAGQPARQEAQQPVPAEFATLVRARTRGQLLVPVARIATRRRLTILLDRAGESLAEVASDDVSAQTMGASTTVSRWREVEVELTGGDRRLLKDADTLLRNRGLRRASQQAKLERALGTAPGPGTVPGPGTAGPGARPKELTTAIAAVLAYLQTQVATLTSLDPMVRRDEPEAVHRMRVATRRLRSTLRSFCEVISAEQTASLAAELKWLAGVLGAERDSEVLPAHLKKDLRDVPAENVIGPVRARVRGHYAPIRAAAHADVLAALDSARYFELLDGLDRLLEEPPPGPRAAAPVADAIGRAVRHASRKVDKRMRRARHVSAGPAREVAFHQARKAAKRARYAAEVAGPAKLARRMKRVQSVLGDHQDAVIARQAARELGIAAQLAGEPSFSYGLLYEHETAAAERLRAEAVRAWRRTRGARP